MSLARLSATLRGLRGWRRHGLAALLGVIATAALPPVHAFPLLIPAFTGLLWLLDGARRPREAALIGWSFGFGHFASGLYWVGAAFLVDAARFGLVMPFAVAGLAAGMALFPALVTLLVGLISWRGAARVALFATAWLAVEWLRAWILTGFPWNLLGTVWSFSPAMSQLAALTGVWGLSLVTLLAAAAPAVLGSPAARPDGGGAPRRRAWAFAVGMMALPAVIWVGGALRLASAPDPDSYVVEGVRLRLVQPSINQALKWRPEHRRAHVSRQIKMTMGPGFDGISHVIWAETAVPYFLSQESDLRRVISRAVPPGGLLLSGAPRGDADSSRQRVWNSLHALDPTGQIVGTFDKFHLVPFGEYVPFRAVLQVAKLTVGSLDFSPGPGPQTLKLAGLPPVSPLICYEAIFPGQVTAPGDRPGWLLNVTNDAWFGISAGPYQHFASARLRAVEEGLPLVRVANSGITAVVDSYGRVLGRLDLGEVGVLDASLPKPVASLTLYARTGNRVVVALFLGMALYTLILRRFLV